MKSLLLVFIISISTIAIPHLEPKLEKGLENSTPMALFLFSYFAQFKIIIQGSQNCFNLPQTAQFFALINQINTTASDLLSQDSLSLLQDRYTLSTSFSNLMYSFSCMETMSDFQTMLGRLGVSDMTTFAEYFAVFFSSFPDDAIQSFNNTVYYLNQGNYPFAGVSAAGFVQFMVGWVKNYRMEYFQTMAFFRGIFTEVGIPYGSDLSGCLNISNMTGEIFVELLEGISFAIEPCDNSSCLQTELNSYFTQNGWDLTSQIQKQMECFIDIPEFDSLWTATGLNASTFYNQTLEMIGYPGSNAFIYLPGVSKIKSDPLAAGQVTGLLINQLSDFVSGMNQVAKNPNISSNFQDMSDFFVSLLTQAGVKVSLVVITSLSSQQPNSLTTFCIGQVSLSTFPMDRLCIIKIMPIFFSKIILTS